MAIILPPTPSGIPLEDIILKGARPALLVRDGRVQLADAGEFWTDRIEAHRQVIEYAIRGVGRVETDGGAEAFVGTAFLVDPSRAVTASFVAEALLQYRAPDGDATAHKPLRGVWLNLKAENGSDTTERIAIRDIQLMPEHWGLAFLILDSNIESDCILRLSEQPKVDGEICVIGYPALDVRNDPEASKAIFGDIFGVKRVMPGQHTGASRWGPEEALVLNHDATTAGGTSGAPLIDIITGSVLGIQIGGQYGVSNYAIPAQEILLALQHPKQPARKQDKQEVLASAAKAARLSIGVTNAQAPILSFDEVLDFHVALTRIGVTDNDKIRTLLLGLPTEYVGALPQSAAAPAERLLVVLHEMNRIGGCIGEHSAFYYVCRNAERMRSWDASWVAAMQDMVKMLLPRETERGCA